MIKKGHICSYPLTCMISQSHQILIHWVGMVYSFKNIWNERKSLCSGMGRGKMRVYA